MEWPLKIQGRSLEEADVMMIRDWLIKHPDWCRSRLSIEICRHWGWRRPDGLYKDMACREMLRKLEDRSLIILPPRLKPGPGHLPEVEAVEVDQAMIRGSFADIKPVKLVDARISKDTEMMFNHLMRTFHYLSFGRTVGQNMKHIFFDRSDRVLGCVLFGAAAWTVEDRDRWIGWNVEARERNLNRICNNTRFLILPWVEVPHLASHALSACLKRLATDWTNRYGSPVVLVETFVDTTRFQGSCYKAANWQRVGRTKGRGRQDRHNQMKVPVKDIWLYPVYRGFRNVLMA